ncbi:hypothetical protein PF008_g28316 [Phytophthora fragariae]|uniref:Uncharacterized protein n=1 Tax=Phytophthora fragariae TaxID=53985 RepID=A0A6G0QBS2_9STRA|nr:hypothetical protein PF008_g28316 [Phytophthora fragariae]
MYTCRAPQPALAITREVCVAFCGACIGAIHFERVKVDRADDQDKDIARGPFDERQEKRDEAELSVETCRLLMVFNQPTYTRVESLQTLTRSSMLAACMQLHVQLSARRVEAGLTRVTWPSRRAPMRCPSTLL